MPVVAWAACPAINVHLSAPPPSGGRAAAEGGGLPPVNDMRVAAGEGEDVHARRRGCVCATVTRCPSQDFARDEAGYAKGAVPPHAVTALPAPGASSRAGHRVDRASEGLLSPPGTDTKGGSGAVTGTN